MLSTESNLARDRCDVVEDVFVLIAVHAIGTSR
jgi:hypothetical protein